MSERAVGAVVVNEKHMLMKMMWLGRQTQLNCKQTDITLQVQVVLVSFRLHNLND